MYQPNDKYAQKAKNAGWRSRAVYKLEEIDHKFSLFQSGDMVLDLGAAPGSWLQYAAKKVGKKGKIFGIDLAPIKPLTEKNIYLIKQDIFQTQNWLNILPKKIDIILSDAAPATSGIKFVDCAKSVALVEQSLKIAKEILKSNGKFCAKIFLSPEAEHLYQQMKKYFSVCHRLKPRASRTDSKETYYVGIGYKPPGKTLI